MSKRTLLLVVALIVSLAVASTGTLAFLTATDSDVNVMTLGNVDIEQHEMKRAEGVKHYATLEDGDLVPFEDGIKLYPAYPVNNAASDYSAEGTDGSRDRVMYWGPYVHTGTAYNGLWDDAKLVGAVDKMVFVENTGSSDAYFRTLIAYECPEGIKIGEPSQGAEIMINENGIDVYGAMAERFVDYITVDGVRYAMVQYVYADALLPGEWSHPSLLQVVMTHNATNEDMELLGETYEILVLSQAVATENMPTDPAVALDTAFGKVNVENATKWFSEMEGMPVTPVATAEELTAALAEGGTVVLTNDLELDGDTTIAVPAGTSATLVLGGNTITAESDQTSKNVDVFDVRGELTVTNGTLELTHTGDNMGWNRSTQLFNVTAGGVLNLDGVTAVNNGGSDMGFVVHLNNWGEVTLNVNNSTLKSNYCAVRVFNSGYDMNNVTIENTTLESEGNRSLWVHNYIGDLNATQHPDDKVNARLNFDIFDNGNTFINNGTKPVIHYGFGTTVYFNADGVQVDVNGNPV